MGGGGGGQRGGSSKLPEPPLDPPLGRDGVAESLSPDQIVP